ncbi:MAG: LamG domain-containing protein [Akkermansiaceae bacterium]|nr:LamG domain-containing protein [Akkermansiaceae bacterium]
MQKKNITSVCLLFLLAGLPSSLEAAGQTPLLWWSFDQDPTAAIKDQAAGIEDSIEGNFKHVPGVAGSALKPDGYTTCITRNTVEKPLLLDSAFTVEAWVAHAAYPWNWCPVLCQSKGQTEGFSFNVGPNGDIALEIAVGGKWQRCVSTKNLIPLRKWKHIAATCDSKSGIRLYVDGQPAGQLDVEGEINWAGQTQLRSLMNYEAVKPSNIHREHGTLPRWFSMDGLVDEVKMYGTALAAADVAGLFKANAPAKDPELPLRVMPSGPQGPGRFGAYYCNLKYYEEWDNLWPVASDPDVVVRFDNSGTRMVFWRGSRYSPAWVSENGLWMADQSVEAFYGNKPRDTEGCFEHMQDRRCRYSHVRVIENTDARVVVHWRYAPVSSHDHLWAENPKTGRALWVDEYYYVYPDQLGIRNVSWKSGTLGDGGVQFQESLPFTQPGQMQGDVVNLDFADVANLKGEVRTLKFCKEPDQKKEFPENLLVQRYNFKSVNKPSIIFETGNRMHYVTDRGIGDRGLDLPGSCNHWPVGQAACDGRTVQAADRPTHFLGFPISSPPKHEKDGRSWWNGLYGMTGLSMPELVVVARSWNNAPVLESKNEGFESEGYDLGQRCYVLKRGNDATGDTLAVRIMASEDSPVYNLALVVKNWDKESLKLTLNGKEIERGKDFRMGVHRSLEESQVMIWIKTQSTEPVSITLK